MNSEINDGTEFPDVHVIMITLHDSEKLKDAAKLRRRAEERLGDQRKSQSSTAGDRKTAEETTRLVHELQVHQIELEMQNEELQQARAQVETLLAQYTDLYDFAPVGYLTLDGEGAIRQVNLTGERLLGVERSRLMNRRFDLFVAEADRRAFNDYLRKVFTSQAKACCEVTLRQEGHPPFFVQIEGVLTEDGQECRMVVLDLTERKRTKEVLRQSEGLRLSSLLRIATRLNAELDLEKLLNAVCAETVRSLDVPGASITLYEPDLKVFRFAAGVGLAREASETVRPIPGSLYDDYVRRNGSPFVLPDAQLVLSLTDADPARKHHRHTVIVASLRHVDKLIGTLNIHTHGTPLSFSNDDYVVLQGLADQAALAIINARLFTEIDQQREQLHALHRQLADTHEVERRQLAQELHDQVSQNLTAIGLNLNLLRTQMPLGMDSAVQTRLTNSLALVEQTTESVRSVMANLRPSVLDDYGLVAALRWYGTEVAARSGLAIDVLGEEPVSRLTAPVENTLFRIAQEALTNVVKHARASQVTLAVELERKKVRLLIADNGIGFNHGLLTKPGNHRHWGLRVMTERAAAVKGLCRFESSPGKGTQVIVEAPL